MTTYAVSWSGSPGGILRLWRWWGGCCGRLARTPRGVRHQRPGAGAGFRGLRAVPRDGACRVGVAVCAAVSGDGGGGVAADRVGGRRSGSFPFSCPERRPSCPCVAALTDWLVAAHCHHGWLLIDVLVGLLVGFADRDALVTADRPLVELPPSTIAPGGRSVPTSRRASDRP